MNFVLYEQCGGRNLMNGHLTSRLQKHVYSYLKIMHESLGNKIYIKYTYMYMHTHKRIYIYMYVHTRIYIHNMCIYINIPMYVYVHIYIYVVVVQKLQRLDHQ